MVDFGIDELGQLSVARVVYCGLKCIYEQGVPRPTEPEYTDKNFTFLRCVAECSSPVPLPDRDDEDEDEDSN